MTRGEAVCTFDLACNLRAKPTRNRFIAYVLTAFMQKVFNIPE